MNSRLNYYDQGKITQLLLITNLFFCRLHYKGGSLTEPELQKLPRANKASLNSRKNRRRFRKR